MNEFNLAKDNLDELDMIVESVLQRERFQGRQSRMKRSYLKRERKVSNRFMMKQRLEQLVTWLQQQTYHGSVEKLKPGRTNTIEEQTIKKVEATA